MADLEGRCFKKYWAGNGKGWMLSPADHMAESWMEELPEGKEIIVTGRSARHPEYHRWFFALLHKIVENSDDWMDEEELLDALKLAVGHCRQAMDMDGKMHYWPKSISFAAMGQEAFKRFVRRVEYVLTTKLKLDVVALMAETSREQRYDPFQKRARKKTA